MTEATTTDTSHAKQDCDPETPHARKAERQHGKPDQLKEAEAFAENRQEALVDEGLEESFPASDPLSAKRIT
ncbi:hypothetical protein BH10PSE1_BH10PSE1_31580 [soil metagenome]